MVYHEQVPPEDLAHCISQRIHGSIAIDGDLAKPSWKGTQKSGRFIDMVSGEPAILSPG